MGQTGTATEGLEILHEQVGVSTRMIYYWIEKGTMWGCRNGEWVWGFARLAKVDVNMLTRFDPR